MKTGHVILLLISLVTSFFAGFHYRKVSTMTTPSKADTVTIIDTLRSVLPVPSIELGISEVEIPYPIIINEKGQERVDTIYVPVPITQKEYSTSDYRAWVSGYNAAMDSIYVFPRTIYITQKTPGRRWGLGIVAGYGVGRSGLSPYIGFGGYYRIW